MNQQSLPKATILTFPGNNGDTENLRTMKRCGFDAQVFRWNDDRSQLTDTQVYFIGAGFSYEDRGRAGMVAARDSLFAWLHEEAAKGKVIVGHCNGCQMLVESGLIPLGDRLQMCMAKNTVQNQSVGFLNEWIWITPTCKRDRCATSDWEGTMQIPIAHGEGRFTTKDPDLLAELKANDQIAFSYCNPAGQADTQAPYCPNGSLDGIAGLCNQAGNVVAMMPHAERTPIGDPYFQSIHQWLERKIVPGASAGSAAESAAAIVASNDQPAIEIFIDTKIVNNEERTVEQAAKRLLPSLTLKQLKYLALDGVEPQEVLARISQFNPNKETAYIRRGEAFTRWNSDTKTEEAVESILTGVTLVRHDEPTDGTGVCYVCSNVTEQDLEQTAVQEVFGNPHASTLIKL